MERRPTIIDVAKAAGVSKSTVSLVLQNSPLVKRETREDVRRVMREIGYVYNRAAANLRSSNVGLIGLVINDLRNPFFTEFATSVQMALSARGYATVVANTDEDAEVQGQVVGAMIEHGVSGLILSSAYGAVERGFEQIARSGIPTLQVLRHAHPDTELFPFAAPDGPQGGRLATLHLLQQGAKRIAFAGGLMGRSVTEARLAGYRAVLAERGLPERVLTGRPNRAFGREAALWLAKDYPDVDAVLCFNDLTALGIMSGCAEIGRRVGPDLKVAGFDDIEESALVFPSLTSVRSNIAGFGQAMAANLLAWLEEGVKPAAEILSPVELITRASTQ
ncbi:LacI family DNA-binding transcriptional regulator [Xinfangfangia sp. CPCC 101601]|uniref:LacI family DNA-binding transcriptional regulator n=1 Tax=Pseudogemmobacter lacusdianii TaxID=3069608 RepID=A0ABU0VTG2_9RHOB|nr:LacI family DNA-binding transcriptional regulator [Xinfangfangia sp. CPCC 101601]MDQ2064958.1 LacI family DNA-binding transcriptional regulator [Xinfangfangia sp. CPCC 101601]